MHEIYSIILHLISMPYCVFAYILPAAWVSHLSHIYSIILLSLSTPIHSGQWTYMYICTMWSCFKKHFFMIYLFLDEKYFERAVLDTICGEWWTEPYTCILLSAQVLRYALQHLNIFIFIYKYWNNCWTINWYTFSIWKFVVLFLTDIKTCIYIEQRFKHKDSFQNHKKGL